MIDKEDQEKLLAEVLKVAKEAEELYRQHYNDVVDDEIVSVQIKSYRLFRRKATRCRQLKGLLDAEKLRYDNKRLEKIIEAFATLKEPELEKFMLF